MKLLVDMNLSPRWIDFLTNAGLEAVHWSAIGEPNAPDSEIMRYAAEHGYIVLTHDLDFSAILAASHGEKPSVIQLRAEDINYRAIGSRVIATLLHMTAQLEAGAILTITSHHIRVRMLPL
jgi:predicted nuclease of predicted toxin-antitoxin system